MSTYRRALTYTTELTLSAPQESSTMGYHYLASAVMAAYAGLARLGSPGDTARVVAIESGATLRRYEVDASGYPRCTYRMR